MSICCRKVTQGHPILSGKDGQKPKVFTIPVDTSSEWARRNSTPELEKMVHG